MESSEYIEDHNDENLTYKTCDFEEDGSEIEE